MCFVVVSACPHHLCAVVPVALIAVSLVCVCVWCRGSRVFFGDFVFCVLSLGCLICLLIVQSACIMRMRVICVLCLCMNYVARVGSSSSLLFVLTRV